MASRYRLNANYYLPERAGDVNARTDLLAAALGALHPAALVESAAATRLLGGVVRLRVVVNLAGQGEADDCVARIRNAPGMPPVDAVEATLLSRS